MSLAWLAQALASQGAVVVAANHPGSTTGDSLPERSARLWQQTQDISALISAVSQDSRWNRMIDPRAIGVIGHSKGGYSAIALLGGRVVLTDVLAGCRRAPDSPNCRFYTRAGVRLETLSEPAFNASYTDARIRFAVALDPGMAPYIQPGSLSHTSAPLLIIVPRYYQAREDNLGGARLAAYAGEQPIHSLSLPVGNHFDFLPLCTEQAPHILAEEGEQMICASPPGQREAVHQQTIRHVLAFLRPWLSAPLTPAANKNNRHRMVMIAASTSISAAL